MTVKRLPATSRIIKHHTSLTAEELQRGMQADFDLLLVPGASDDELRGALHILRAQARRWGCAAPSMPKPTYSPRTSTRTNIRLRLLPTQRVGHAPAVKPRPAAWLTALHTVDYNPPIPLETSLSVRRRFAG